MAPLTRSKGKASASGSSSNLPAEQHDNDTGMLIDERESEQTNLTPTQMEHTTVLPTFNQLSLAQAAFNAATQLPPALDAILTQARQHLHNTRVAYMNAVQAATNVPSDET
ncbi:hypothetical protein BGW41_008033 [Actinomortierella wolfii]|nr:hypothetical protein BGW41_008033 [Actinomortierella wolfii]